MPSTRFAAKSGRDRGVLYIGGDQWQIAIGVKSGKGTGLVGAAEESSSLSIAIALSAKGIEFPFVSDRESSIGKELGTQEAGLAYMHVVVLAAKPSVGEFLLGKVLIKDST